MLELAAMKLGKGDVQGWGTPARGPPCRQDRTDYEGGPGGITHMLCNQNCIFTGREQERDSKWISDPFLILRPVS